MFIIARMKNVKLLDQEVARVEIEKAFSHVTDSSSEFLI